MNISKTWAGIISMIAAFGFANSILLIIDALKAIDAAPTWSGAEYKVSAGVLLLTVFSVIAARTFLVFGWHYIKRDSNVHQTE